jgi:acetoacetyl-CoA synthetase
MSSSPRLLWKPSGEFADQSNLKKYTHWLQENKKLVFDDYNQLWKWSTDNAEDFWLSIWEYFNVHSSTPFDHVMKGAMPRTSWFKGATLNYAEHIFKNADPNNPAIIFASEKGDIEEISWTSLKSKVASLASYLRSRGIEKGDRVVAFLPNIPEATLGFLAANSIGAVWSSCSPDFGSSSVVDRFQQIKPKALITVDGYWYNSKPFDKKEVVKEIIAELPTLEMVVEINYLDKSSSGFLEDSQDWNEVTSNEAELVFEMVPFEHPIWVLYSSGTTGQPKAITHSVGGVLLEHLKYLSFHNDVKKGERFFWYTTTGWMMWNFVQAALLVGATIVLYDGSVAYPDLNALWKLAERTRINHFGTSAPFILACLKKGIDPINHYNLENLRSISSTGSPLPPAGFDWIYDAVKRDVWLCSMSGGTDVCSAFVGGCPTEPLYEGAIQCRVLGCSIYSYSDQGVPLEEEVGEMVITKPMPSMPIYFWNDHDYTRYHESYFEDFEGIWRHGDWLWVSKRGSLKIMGRSDATLNRHGIRIGTAEIYQVIDKIDEIKDSLVINIERDDGNHFMPLFVVMKEGVSLSKEIEDKINDGLKKAFTARHVPDEIIEVKDIPYTISGKKMEAPVKKILMGTPIEKAANIGAMKNPDSLNYFSDYAKKLG